MTFYPTQCTILQLDRLAIPYGANYNCQSAGDCTIPGCSFLLCRVNMKVKLNAVAEEPAAEEEPDLVLPVLQDLLICLQILLNSFLELDTVNLDPEEGG